MSGMDRSACVTKGIAPALVDAPLLGEEISALLSIVEPLALPAMAESHAVSNRKVTSAAEARPSTTKPRRPFAAI
jgi:hypothetical protein